MRFGPWSLRTRVSKSVIGGRETTVARDSRSGPLLGSPSYFGSTPSISCDLTRGACDCLVHVHLCVRCGVLGFALVHGVGPGKSGGSANHKWWPCRMRPMAWGSASPCPLQHCTRSFSIRSTRTGLSERYAGLDERALVCIAVLARGRPERRRVWDRVRRRFLFQSNSSTRESGSFFAQHQESGRLQGHYKLGRP